MGTTTTNDLATHVLATLRAHEPELRAAGIRRLSLFGSVARGDHGEDSDVDLAAELDGETKVGLIRLMEMEDWIGGMLGRKVDLVPLARERSRLHANVERDSVLAF